MKKGKLKKILASSAMGIMALAMPFALTGCDKDLDINVRVEGEYVQWQVDGEDSWKNLITITEVLDAIGDDIKGETGEQGIAGKQVEFDKSSTHIVWRYVGDADWKNLIAFSDLQQQDNPQDVEELKQRGFELFQSKLTDLNGNYKVTYDYLTYSVVESFNYLELTPDGLFGDRISVRTAVEYRYGVKNTFSDGTSYRTYSLVCMAEKYNNITPERVLTSAFTWNVDEYKFFGTGGGYGGIYGPDKADKNFDFEYVNRLKAFELKNVIACEFGPEGNCKLTLSYNNRIVDGKSYTHKPYLNDNFIYEFNISKDGNIEKCYVYERDYINTNQKGNLYCRINYEKGESLIDVEFLNEAFDKVIEGNQYITTWWEYFGFSDVNN